MGLQGGVIFLSISDFSLGLVEMIPRMFEFKKVADFDANVSLDNLDLEAPLKIGAGATYTFRKILIAAGLKWVFCHYFFY